MDNIGTVTAETFDAVVTQTTGRVVVEFMSYGCVHCRTMEPILQQVAQSVAGSERVLRVNIALDEALALRYGVEGTPTLVMFLDGHEVGRVEGPSPVTSVVYRAVTEPFASGGF